MVRAINKNGEIRDFTDRIWGIMPKHKNGWVEFEEPGELIVPLQIVEFQQKLKDKKEVVDAVKDDDEIPKMDIKTTPPPKRKPVKRLKK